MHKQSRHMVAIKQIPLDTDLIEIIREIKVLGENDHPNVVRYYGSYLKDSNLWIIMEFCGAGSCADIMRFRQRPFSEPQIASIFSGVVCGLAYVAAPTEPPFCFC
jgi:serine/threonine protein kinase